MSGNQSSTFNPPPEVTPPPEQPEVPPVPEISVPGVPPPVQDPLPSETVTPPEQFADPPRNEVPQPDPANFQVGKILYLALRIIIYNYHCFSSVN